MRNSNRRPSVVAALLSAFFVAVALAPSAAYAHSPTPSLQAAASASPKSSPSAPHSSASTAPTTSASGSGTNGPLFGVKPALEGNTTLKNGHFNFNLTSGSSASDGLVVENFSSQTLTFAIYSADLLEVQGGGVAPAQETAPKLAVGKWISVSRSSITLPPRTQTTIAFTITVPAYTTPGQHLGAMVAAANIGKASNGVSVQARTALIVDVTIPGKSEPGAKLGELTRKVAPNGDMTFSISVTNTGNVLLENTGDIVVRDGKTILAKLPLQPPGSYVIPQGTSTLTTRPYKTSAYWTITATGDIALDVNSSPWHTYDSNTVSWLVIDWLSVIEIAALVLVALIVIFTLIRRLHHMRKSSVEEKHTKARDAEVNKAALDRLRNQ